MDRAEIVQEMKRFAERTKTISSLQARNAELEEELRLTRELLENLKGQLATMMIRNEFRKKSLVTLEDFTRNVIS